MTMSKNPSRRQVSKSAAIAAAAPAVALAFTSIPARAYQGNMEHALTALQEAFGALQQATPNKGGHREHAMDLIQRAMWQVRAGINFANAHGGGGW